MFSPYYTFTIFASFAFPTCNCLITTKKKKKKKLPNSFCTNSINGKLLLNMFEEWSWNNYCDPILLQCWVHHWNNELQEVAQERIWTSLETNSNYVQISIVHEVLFDMDGVLCDNKHYSWEIVIILFAEMSVTVTTTNVVIFMGIGRFFFFFFFS
jgi:hypothetical protein